MILRSSIEKSFMAKQLIQILNDTKKLEILVVSHQKIHPSVHLNSLKALTPL